MTLPNDDDDGKLWDMERHAQKRTRRFWIWMGLLPGVGWALVLWLSLPLGLQNGNYNDEWMAALLLPVVWTAYCAGRVAGTCRQWSPVDRVMLGVGMFLAFMAVNIVIFYALLLGSCMLVANVRRA